MASTKEKEITLNGVDQDPNGENIDKPFESPILALGGVVVFPYTLSPLVIEGDDAIKTIESSSAKNRLVALFSEIPDKSENVDQLVDVQPHIDYFEYQEKKLSRIGVLARIVKTLKFPDGTVRVLVRGMRRVRFLTRNRKKKSCLALIENITESEEENLENVAMARNALSQFQEIIDHSPNFPEELKIAIINVTDHSRTVDLIADTINISYLEKLTILVLPTLHERLQLLTILLNREVEVLHLGSEIQSQVSNALSKSQREFFLREQLKTIKKELGEESRNPDVVAIEQRLEKLSLPDSVEETVRAEMERLDMIHQASGEYHVVYTYIDWLLTVPWNVFSEDQLHVDEAARILNEDHFDLEDVKTRILEFLAVLQLKKDRKSPILCFVGPPGVGKTSLGKSIARAMGRKFVRISLGGIRDEAEIRGHRRTYVGALPGRIIQGMKKAGSSNPVFMLDEIDKIGSDFRGDPASALLEVLDPEQNSTFNDHYLELDFDLSTTMFIATANILDTIPPALLDRMEIIRLPGYTAMEKKQIANRFLIPRQLLENGLKKRQLYFKSAVIDEIIQSYTREAGVRNLERKIAAVCRKTARKIVEDENASKKRFTPNKEDIPSFLGPRRFFSNKSEEKPELGLATGLAWTSAGGEILAIEATMMPGKGDLKLTGNLGDVMKESAQTAFSLIRSKSKQLKIGDDIFKKRDFHIHVPEAATPKDGPSAGVAIVTALVSLLTGRKVVPDIAMTGEITLRGRINPIGGVKEKVIAALRSGIKTVLLPKKNEHDWEDLSEDVRKKIKVSFTTGVMDVINIALLPKAP